MDLSELEQLRPQATYSPHPLMPGKDRVFIRDALIEGETLTEYFDRTGLSKRIAHQTVRVTINGWRVPREIWKTCRPKAGTRINVQAEVRGGNDGNKVLRTVALIALIVLTQNPAFAAWAGPVGTAATLVVGGLAINALFPLPLPKPPKLPGLENSANYALSGGSNRARLYEPMPIIVGTHRVFPDVGAKPYTEYDGDDQYLYQIFDCGYNDLVCSDFRIGDTPITSFSGVVLEESSTDGVLRLFPSNVDSLAGAQLTAAAGWISRTSSANTTSLAVELTGTLFEINSSGDLQRSPCVFEIQFRKVGDPGWTPIALASDSEPAIYKVVSDLTTTPDGNTTWTIYTTNEVMNWQLSGPLNPGEFRIINETRTPFHRTLRWDVAPGQYEVQVRRITADSTDPTHFISDTIWTQLRSYQPDTTDYTGRKRFALRIRASGQLNGTVDQFNFLASARTLPPDFVWAGTEDAPAVAFDFTRGTTTPIFGASVAPLTFTRAGATATRVNASGLIETVAADTPRLDYDPVTLACEGLLLEETRTNYLLRSAELDNASWVKSASTVTANAITGPDGALSMDKIVETTAVTTLHRVSQNANAGAVNTMHAYSAFVQKGERTKFYMWHADATLTTSYVMGVFDLVALTATTQVGGNGASASATIEHFKGDIYICTIVGIPNTAGAGVAHTFDLRLRDATGNQTYTGDGVSGLYATGFQLEPGECRTSYIPTTTAAATRNLDLALVKTIAFYNAVEGSMVGEFVPLGLASSLHNYAASFNDGTGNELNAIRLAAGSATNQVIVQDGGVAQATLSNGTTAVGQVSRVASAYKLNDFALTANGAAVVTDVSGTLPTPTQLSLGTLVAGTHMLNGHLRGFTYYPKRLSNATLQTLSANGPAISAALPSSNPAWWLLKGYRGEHVGARRAWGAGLDDSRIDIPSITSFATFCDTNGLTANGVFDQPIAVNDMLSQIALAGRGTITPATGKYGVVWDAPSQPVVATFSMANIVAGTFEIEYASEQLADEIVATFINPSLGYKQDTVRVLAPSVTTPAISRQIDLPLCTNQTEAAQAANLYLAGNLYRPRRYRWQMDFEGMPLSRGEVGMLGHDLASFDRSGRLATGSTDTVLQLDRAVTMVSSSSYYITVVKPDGTMVTRAVTAGDGNFTSITLPVSLGFNPSTDVNHPEHDYKFLFGSASEPGRKVKIDSIRPVSESLVELSAVDETTAYYDARLGTFASVTPPTFGAAPTLSDLALTADGVRSGTGYVVKVTAQWKASGGYSSADVRVGINDGALQLKGVDVRGTHFDFFVNDGDTVAVEITGYGTLGKLGQSAKLALTQLIDFASTAVPSDVTSFMGQISPTSIDLTWAKAPEVDVVAYEVRYGASWAAGVTVFRGNALEYKDASRLAGTHVYWVKAIDSAGLESVNAAQAQVTVNSIAAPVVQATVEQTDVVLSWTAPPLQFDTDTYEVRYGTDFASGVSVGKTKSTTLKLPITWLTARTFWVAVTDVASQTSPAGSVVVDVSAGTAPAVSAQIVGENAVLSWVPSIATLPVREYEIRYGASYAAGTKIARIKGTSYTFKADWSGTRTFFVAGYDSSENESANGSVAVVISVPSAPAVSQQVIDNTVLLQWTDAQQTLPIKHYEIRRGATFATATVIGTVGARFSVLFEDSAGDYVYWVVGVDSANNYGVEASVTATVAQPPDFILYTQSDSELDSTSRSNWLRIKSNNTVLELNGSTQYGQVASVPDLDSGVTGITLEAWVYRNASGNYGYIEKTVAGAVNTEALLFSDATNFIMRVKVGASLFSATYAHNTNGFTAGQWVHLVGRWDSTNGVQIAVNGVNRTTVAAAGALGQGAGALLVGKLGTGATYPFAGQLGPCRVYSRRITDTEVAEHYNDIFKSNANIVAAWDFDEASGAVAFDDSDNAYDLQLFATPTWVQSALDGRYDLTLTAPKVYAPVVADESLDEYATRTGYTTWDAAITAGYNYVFAPAPTTAQYVEVIDYGTPIPSTKISATLVQSPFLGSVTITPKISVKLNAGDAWTDFAGVWSAYAVNFRYVKITLDFAGAGGNNLVVGDSLTTKLDVKLKSDSGTADCLSTDVGGTQVDFTVPFVDVRGIQVTPRGTTPITAVVDFVDAINPTNFKVLLFDPQTGSRVSGTVGWAADGV